MNFKVHCCPLHQPPSLPGSPGWDRVSGFAMVWVLEQGMLFRDRQDGVAERALDWEARDLAFSSYNSFTLGKSLYLPGQEHPHP